MDDFYRSSQKRRKRHRNVASTVLATVIVVLMLAVIGLILYFILGSKGCQKPSVLPSVETTESADTEAPDESTSSGEEIEENQVLSKAKYMAGTYDYDGAIAYVKAQIPNYEDDMTLVAFIEECNAKKQKLVKFADNSTITHIFFHTLVQDNVKAWASYKSNDYNQVMTTIDEFNKIMEIMHDEGYVLVHLSDIAKITEQADGSRKMTWQPIYLPEGKKPFVLSVDDVSYYEYMNNTGFATKLVIDENGRVINEKATYKQVNANNPKEQPVLERDANGAPIVESVEYGDFDVVPLLDKFVEAHPDFSYHGAKGTIALTGYNGVLGYKTSEIEYGAGDPNFPKAYEYRNVNIEQDRIEAKKVADAMKATGWKFASHTWGHMNMGTVVDTATGNYTERFTRDTTWWLQEVAPIVGPTDIIIFAFGADIGHWRGYTEDNAAYMYLKQAGFDYFCNVDSAKYWVQLNSTCGGDGYLRQGRRNLDGTMMFKALCYPEKNLLSDLFDPKDVFDRLRPLPVSGVTVPDGLDLSKIFN